MQLPRLSCKEGRGKGAGWYARQQPQRSKREGMRCCRPDKKTEQQFLRESFDKAILFVLFRANCAEKVNCICISQNKVVPLR